MDCMTTILHDENEIINCRRVNEYGDIEFYGYMTHLFQELGDYLEEVDYLTVRSIQYRNTCIRKSYFII